MKKGTILASVGLVVSAAFLFTGCEFLMDLFGLSGDPVLTIDPSDTSVEIEVGETYNFTVVALDKNDKIETFTATTDNSTVASVAKDGTTVTVTGVAEGSATITITSASSEVVMIDITVTAAGGGDDGGDNGGGDTIDLATMTHHVTNWDFDDQSYTDSPSTSHDYGGMLYDSVPGWNFTLSASPMADYYFEANPDGEIVTLLQSADLNGCEMIMSQTLSSPYTITSGSYFSVKFRIVYNGPAAIDYYDTAPVKVYITLAGDSIGRLLLIKNNIAGAYTTGDATTAGNPDTNYAELNTWYTITFALAGHSTLDCNHPSYPDARTLVAGDVIESISFSSHNDYFEVEVDHITICD